MAVSLLSPEGASSPHTRGYLFPLSIVGTDRRPVPAYAGLPGLLPRLMGMPTPRSRIRGVTRGGAYVARRLELFLACAQLPEG